MAECWRLANYAVRWLKVNTATWNGDTAMVGIYGSSSGGHVAELVAMRPRDPRYNAIPLAAAPNVDATVAYAATRSPISDTFARYENAVRRGNESMIKNNKVFFNPWETILHEANPQEILEREEKVTLVISARHFSSNSPSFSASCLTSSNMRSSIGNVATQSSLVARSCSICRMRSRTNGLRSTSSVPSSAETMKRNWWRSPPLRSRNANPVFFARVLLVS